MPWPTAGSLRARIPDMNDGIIATAGEIEGFLAAAERDAELVLIMNETRGGCPSCERR